jgi:hypothetical protein
MKICAVYVRRDDEKTPKLKGFVPNPTRPVNPFDLKQFTLTERQEFSFHHTS